MRHFLFSSLRGRLLVLILSAVLPALGWALYTGLEERFIQRAQVEENALRLTRLAAGDLVQAVEGARQLLIGQRFPESARSRLHPGSFMTPFVKFVDPLQVLHNNTLYFF